MSGKNRSKEQWLETAVSGIGFWLDREKVEEELRGHLEDKTADLERIFHLNHEEAEEMALKQMGDAEEIGKELAQIHKAWLGRLWLFSQIVVILLLFFTVQSWIYNYDEQWADLKRDFLGWEYSDSVMFDPWRWVDQESCRDVQVLELDCPEIQVGQYTVRVEQAQLWHYEDVERYKDDFRIVYVRFRMEQKNPWEYPNNLLSRLRAEDDQGTYILSEEEYMYRKAPQEWAEHMIGEYIAQKPFENVYQVIAVGVSPQAQELTLRYDEMGADFVLPISLEGVPAD